MPISISLMGPVITVKIDFVSVTPVHLLNGLENQRGGKKIQLLLLFFPIMRLIQLVTQQLFVYQHYPFKHSLMHKKDLKTSSPRLC